LASGFRAASRCKPHELPVPNPHAIVNAAVLVQPDQILGRFSADRMVAAWADVIIV